jgi:hypothetical protein
MGVALYKVEEFVEKIKANPAGKFTLEADIDLEDLKTPYQTIQIKDGFALDGKGHAILNVNVPLFEGDSLVVSNLMLVSAFDLS